MSSFGLEDYQRLRQPGRTVDGISAALLPYDREGRIDEAAFRCHLRRTLDARLRVAVNMDTGYVDLLTSEEKLRVLTWTAETAGKSGFVAGALPAPEVAASLKAYGHECETIATAGGTPIIFPSALTAAMDDAALIEFFQTIASSTSRFLAFELGKMFNPNGRIFSARVLSALMAIPQCLGLKHSSLDRDTELQRIELRNRERPGFSIYSGNDLAADMIEYGSDYLLGLSTFAPELFAARDKAWADGKAQYLEYRDFIQYLGWIGFRDPVPAYKHSAAIFLKLTAGLACDHPHPRAPRRESWDRDSLADAARRLERLMPRSQGTAAS
ncbi:MAG TPA: dihydrodipicolinate synthase family protein [Terriglobia bacterium]|nr:dihydrodipicolinate synthase family protein [Terriglobia bacterium]